MGNLCAVLTHCSERGSEFILGASSHIYYYEQGGAATLGGCHPRALANELDGTLPLDAVAEAIREDDQHFPITKLVCVENSHNKCGGRVLPVQYVPHSSPLSLSF
jgi:threonine aldolase